MAADQDLDPGEGTPAPDPARKPFDRNAAVMAAAVASRREEIERESKEIGGDTLPEDDPHDQQEPDATTGDLAEREREGAAEVEAAAPVDAPTDDELVDVKVDGQIIRAKQSDVDDAGGVAAYQKQRAADNRLRQAGEVHKSLEERERSLRNRAFALGIDYDTGQPLQQQQQIRQQPRQSSTTQPQISEVDDAALRTAVKEASQKIALAADPDEIEESLGRVIVEARRGTGVDPSQVISIVRADGVRSNAQREWTESLSRHREVVEDADGWELTRGLIRRQQIDDLVHAGADRIACMNLSDQELGAYHLQARQAGSARRLPDIVEAAAVQAEQRLGIKPAASLQDAGDRDRSRPTGSNGRQVATPRAAAAAIERRQALKGGTAVATSTPASSAVSTSRPQLSMGRTPSEYVAKLRQLRGQSPSGPVT